MNFARQERLPSFSVHRNTRAGRAERRIGRMCLLALMIAYAATTQCQNSWTSLKGPWEARDPVDIAVGYAGSVCYVYTIGGENRELLVSNVKGDEWTPLPLDHVVAVACVKDQPMTVYASRQDGSQNILSKSSDGGATWIDERVFASPVSKIVISPDSPTLVYVGLGGDLNDVNQPLWRSVDGGKNWKQVTSLNIYAKVTQIVFDPAKPSLIYVTTRGTMGGVWKSTDGGGTWSSKNTGMTNVQIASLGITPAPQTNLLYAGTAEQGAGDQEIFGSTDGGEHWTVRVRTSGAADIAVDPVRPNFAYAATRDGLLCTRDSGVSWVKKNNGIASRSGLRIGVLPEGNQKVHVMLGTRAAFYRTDDDGDHWSEKTFGMALVSCYGVAVNDAGIFSVAFGDRTRASFVNYSTDGSTWNVLQDDAVFNDSSGSPFYGFAIAGSPFHANVLLASGTSGENYPQILFRSSDAGNTWVKVYNGIDFSNQPCNILFDPNDDRLVYTADWNHVLKSSDDGITWTQLQNSPPYVFSIGIASSTDPGSRTLYAAGSRQVCKSEDGGKTWSSASAGLPDPVVSLACDPGDSRVVFAGTNHHRVFRTTDGGQSWQPRSEGIYGDFIQSLAVQPANRAVYACAADDYGATTRVYRSTNSGETWRDISNGLGDGVVYDLSADKGHPNTIFCATNRGIFCLSDSWNAVTETRDDDRGLPSSYELDQNYPNPFNPSTTIGYQLPAQGHVTLKVYDMLGKEVTTVVNEELKAGSYRTTFDATGLASGMYFYRLDAGTFTSVKRFLVLK